RERPRRYQGGDRLNFRPWRVRPPEVRIRRASGPARSRDGGEWADSYVRRNSRRAARARGGRRRDQAGGYPYRYDEGERCGRPAREQNGLGGPHYTFADWHRGCLGREVPAPEPEAGHAGAEVPA